MHMQRKRVLPVTAANIRDIEALIKLTVKLMEDSIYNGCSFAFATNGGSSCGIASDIIKTEEQKESVLRILAKLENECNYDFSNFCNSVNYGSFNDVFILTPYIDDNMISFARQLEASDITAVFYTTGEIPQEVYNYQFIHTRKFSYTINAEELE